MSDDERKCLGGGDHHHHHHHHHHHPSAPKQPQHYGTFQDAPVYYQPAIGFPQPVPPPGVAGSPLPHPPYPPPVSYDQGYQPVPVAEGIPLRMPRLPCCGIGIGWFLFIIGFFFAAIPWYVGAFIFLCVRVDFREKPGFIACTIAAVLAAIAVLFGVTKGAGA